jgi:NAD(P)H-dependent flavin oxidoreductase YrpB (nitropropane dioxygenase family)
MKVSTRLTDLVGCALPLQLAAMGGVGTTELAGAVVAAGGLGMVPSCTHGRRVRREFPRVRQPL